MLIITIALVGLGLALLSKVSKLIDEANARRHARVMESVSEITRANSQAYHDACTEARRRWSDVRVSV